MTSSSAVTAVDECPSSCSETPACFKWMLTVTVADNSMTCVHYGNETGATTDPNTDPNVLTFLGDATCTKVEDMPASPEDAQDLGYKEVCQDNQYQEEIMPYDDWNFETCPSTYSQINIYLFSSFTVPF